MEVITIILIVYSILSTIVNGYKIKKSKCRAGNATSCFEAHAELERKKTPGAPDPNKQTAVNFSSVPPVPMRMPSTIEINGVQLHIPKSI